ncbi:NAD(P)-binding protein [Pholiota conissans]|uniref:NAD(P)-binding protein n=1 Tax=Pholiota conissans TaxID=109636 RepID=A0A9P5YXL3_9AGAR|nr:NAD(P)-binding protein [Pholiota conissans]
METIPDTQTAWVVVQQGTPSKALSLETDWPVSKQLKSGEVLVKVQAAALNPAAWKLMLALPNFLDKRPHVAEFDLAGIIVDGNDTVFNKGDKVFGWIPGGVQRRSREGALSQYARVLASDLVERPTNTTPVEAAGITLVGLTAYQAIYHIAKVEADQIVFVNGGSSSLGAFAIQFAKAKGAKVVATASGRNEAFVRKMGADEFIDYTQVGNLAHYLCVNSPPTKYHVIFDAVGLVDPSLYTYSDAYLAPNGVFISSGPIPKSLSFSELWKLVKSIGAMIIPTWLGGIKRRYVLVLTKDRPEDLLEIANMIEAGTIKPVVDSTYSMQDALKAYDRILSGRAVGKVTVIVDYSCDS